MPWEVAYVLPNVQIQLPIETSHTALFPYGHARVKELRKQHPVLERYLARFTDAVGQKIQPSVLMHRSPSPRSTRTADAFAAFRDLLAISIVPMARAQAVTERSRPSRILYSNFFDPFSWFVTNDYKNILLASPAVTHFHNIETFRGHTHPELFTHHLDEYEIDRVLLTRLIEEWNKCFAVKKPSAHSTTLFRSINVAAQAARMPSATAPTLFDIGRLMILWSSAFEILVHPGYHDQKQLSRIYDKLEEVEWVTSFAKRRVYKIYGSPTAKRVAACWLYSHIHKLRNAFVHGNAVDRKMIRLPRTSGPLWMHAAPLYRLMLTAYLDLSFKTPAPTGDLQVRMNHQFARLEHVEAQRLMEQAIRSAKPRSVSRRRKLGVYDRTPHQRILRAGRG